MFYFPNNARPSRRMSNTERQRRFRKRNPGYYGRLHAKRRAAIKALSEALALEAAKAAVTPREPLMLPTPVETIEIPGMTIPLRSRAMASEEAVGVPRD